MRTRITHPSLAELWRVLSASLEHVVGTKDAPILARSLAISGLIGRPARAYGVGVERRGEEVFIMTPDHASTPARSKGPHQGTVRPLAAHRSRALAAR